MHQNERFKLAIAHLKSLGKIKYSKDLAVILNVSEDRIKNLSKKGGVKLDYSEMKLLSANFTLINWDWVSTGEGKMLRAEDEKILGNELPMIYGVNPDELSAKEEEILRIVTGKSELSCAEQRDRLIEAWIFQNNKITKFAQIFAKM